MDRQQLEQLNLRLQIISNATTAINNIEKIIERDKFQWEENYDQSSQLERVKKKIFKQLQENIQEFQEAKIEERQYQISLGSW